MDLPPANSFTLLELFSRVLPTCPQNTTHVLGHFVTEILGSYLGSSHVGFRCAKDAAPVE